MQPDQIAKKIRKTLFEQKAKLEDYVILLEKEAEDIVNKDPDKLIAHINLEKNILTDLSMLKKVINPLQVIYLNSPYKKDNSIIDLENSIDKLTNQIKEKSGKNKEQLETSLDQVKTELKGIRKKGITNSSYNNVESRLVDIRG